MDLKNWVPREIYDTGDLAGVRITEFPRQCSRGRRLRSTSTRNGSLVQSGMDEMLYPGQKRAHFEAPGWAPMGT